MKIGPDGSLPKITSSVAYNNIMVQRVSDADLKNKKGPAYKIFTIGAAEIQNESSSDTSDEEIEDIEIYNIKLGVNSANSSALQDEKEEDFSKDRSSDANGTNRKQSSEMNKISHRSDFNHFRGRERFSRSQNRSRSDVRNSSRNRHYNAASNSKSNYRNVSNNAVAANIDPWMPQMHGIQSFLPIVHNHFPDIADQCRSTKPAIEQQMMSLKPSLESFIPPDLALNSLRSLEPTSESFLRTPNCENPKKSFGLLGDSPYSPFPVQYPQKNQEVIPNSFWNDQNAANESNYWKDDYSNNYHRSVPQERPVPMEQNRMLTYQDNRSYQTWGSNRGKSKPRWNRNRSKKWRNPKPASATTRDGYGPWVQRPKS